MNYITRQTISVLVNDRYVDVEANLLGGEEGVFATCRNPSRYEECWLIAGDDGAWWFVASYHQEWIPGVIAALKRV